MSNSSLVDVVVPASPTNYSYDRSAYGYGISAVTIHHMAGVLSAEQCGYIFQQPDRYGSSHYGIGNDGRIGLYVDESNVAWTNSNWVSNCQSVTIETSNCTTGGDWPVSDAALNSLIKLVADIAKRNNLGHLVPGQNLTWHSMFAATECPGPYLLARVQYIADEANKINEGQPVPPEPTPCDKFNIGDSVIVNGPLYIDSNAATPSGQTDGDIATTITLKAPGAAHPYNTTGDLGWMDESCIRTAEPQPEPPTPEPTPTYKFNVGDKVIINGQLYGDSYGNNPGAVVSNVVTNIILRNDGAPYPYNTTGELGWMSEDSISAYTESQPETFKVGDKVVPTRLVNYLGMPLVQYDPYYTISELSGDRAVLVARGQVWAAMNTNDITHYEG